MATVPSGLSLTPLIIVIIIITTTHILRDGKILSQTAHAGLVH
jgi:hypothetical protein